MSKIVVNSSFGNLVCTPFMFVDPVKGKPVEPVKITEKSTVSVLDEL